MTITDRQMLTITHRAHKLSNAPLTQINIKAIRDTVTLVCSANLIDVERWIHADDELFLEDLLGMLRYCNDAGVLEGDWVPRFGYADGAIARGN